MSNFTDSYFPPPRGWDAFEAIVFDVFTQRLRNDSLKRYGRSGQEQRGVDILGETTPSKYIGIQCKSHPGGTISIREIDSEIEKAESFPVPLSHYIIATSAPRDVTATTHVFTISSQRQQASQFSVEVFFWEDLCHELARTPELVRAHYPDIAMPTLGAQPDLLVTFPSGQNRVELSADWEERPLIEGEMVRRSTGRSGRSIAALIPPPFNMTPAKVPGTTPLCFRVENRSPVEAKNIEVTIDLPQGCRTVFKDMSEIFAPKEKRKALTRTESTISIHLESLLHRPAHITENVYAAFPDAEIVYELTWRAHAGNMLREQTGVLQVYVQSKSEQPMHIFPLNQDT